LWRTRIENPFPIQEEGNGVIICNHRSSVDPFFIQVSVRRVVHWMVAREYCEQPITGIFLRVAQVIPVNRGGIDTASTKAAIRFVSEGGMVGMLPEGRINRTEQEGGMVGMLPEGRINRTEQFMRPVRPGAIIIALKGRAPIIPCYIEGAPFTGRLWSPFLRRARVRVRYGQPIDLSPYYGREKDGEVVRQLLVRCVSAIADLAGQSDFEPEVAGRKWMSRGAQTDTENDATE
jgi:1-acyl-sn-glycerol-3-phosphate acyltransferase